MEQEYIAHFLKEDQKIHIQSVAEHNWNVACLASNNAPLQELVEIAWLCGILHDAGKYGEDFQDYIKRAMNEEKVYPGEVTHSTAGGALMGKYVSRSNLTQIVQMAVLSHHGMNDSFKPDQNKIFIDDRLEKQKNLQQIKDCHDYFVDQAEFQKVCQNAEYDVKQLLENIKLFCENKGKGSRQYGNRNFYLGMYERVLFSLLIDADRTDTACFVQKRMLPIINDMEDTHRLWQQCIKYFEKYLNGFQETSRLDAFRRKISEECMEAGKCPQRLYRLTVPTGAGKTLSSLRFALHHAEKYGKKHIIYVAPYQSILDQNADEIRKALGNPEIVLEHHCNVIQEDTEKRLQYERMTENWDSPVIVTTAVQFLNTLFAGKNSNIRRMYQILNSVIIFDEVQSLPIKITKMFNLALNYLTVFGKSTVVLCSATQPLFDELSENSMLPPDNMIKETDEFQKVFKRTELIDETGKSGLGFSIEELEKFIWEKTKESNQILVIVNTKQCARKVYEGLKARCVEEGILLFHLSTNMCACHRRVIFEKIEYGLKSKKKLICISTQLIEAGVNLSFQCVIRSLAGLDSIIQAAGRCNRHGEEKIGYVHLIQMSKEAENVERLTDILKAQESMQKLLYQFRLQPEIFSNNLFSDTAIRMYYQYYLKSRESEMEYPVLVNGVGTTILDLLSGNEKLWKGMPAVFRQENKGLLLKQAFKTAGCLFEVIQENGQTEVVVEYNDEVKQQKDILESFHTTLEEKKQAIRKLQPYTVSISQSMKQSLGNAITSICDGSILVLSENYYSKETGVSKQPEGMEFMNF